MYTIVIKNCKVVDGSGNPWFKADIGVSGNSIAALGSVDAALGSHVIDGSGLTATPGFIDIHTHSDLPLLVDGDGNSHIRQGVTTNVIGNCGGSVAPITDLTKDIAQRNAHEIDPDLVVDWSTLGQFLRRLEQQGISINVAALVGQGTVRGSVMGFVERRPTDSELAEMCGLVDQAMQDGALGLSSGLIYVPGSYAQTLEIMELAKAAAAHGGVYASHIRGENDTLLDAVEEAIAIGREASIRVQIAHFKAMGRHMWGKSVDSLRMVDNARASGLEVTCDQYPYNASATGLGAYLPAWAHVGGTEALKERLADPAARARLKHDILTGLEGWTSLHKGVGWEKTMITRCADTSIEGMMVSEVAKARGKDDFATAFDVLLENNGSVGVVYFTIGDEDIERIMKHPAVMIGSDSSAISAEGPLARGKPHPRSFGSFVRVLGHYVRELGVINFENAIRKMTSLPAQTLRLHDRGLLRQGFKADIVLLDEAIVADRATYTEPWQYPVGIEHVMVNGVLTVSNSRHLGTRAGHVIHRS